MSPKVPVKLLYFIHGQGCYLLQLLDCWIYNSWKNSSFIYVQIDIQKKIAGRRAWLGSVLIYCHEEKKASIIVRKLIFPFRKSNSGKTFLNLLSGPQDDYSKNGFLHSPMYSFVIFLFFLYNCLAIYLCTRDIHIECSKQFKWNWYFYVSGQSGPFWAVLKLLQNSNMKFK